MRISLMRQIVHLESVLWLLHQYRLSRGLAAKCDAQLWSRQNLGTFDSFTVCFEFASLYIQTLIFIEVMFRIFSTSN